MGNLHSVQTAFRRLNKGLKIVSSPSDLKSVNALILPGVGAFDPAMAQLEKSGLIPYIKNWTREKKPLLGICLGLQLLFESSDEGTSKGLGLLKGQIQKLPSNQNERIPHMGWAPLQVQNSCPLIDKEDNPSWVYFVHSYFAKVKEKSDLAATAPFGQKDVTAIVWKDKLGACQFHPEKSSMAGQILLRRWLKWLEDEGSQT